VDKNSLLHDMKVEIKTATHAVGEGRTRDQATASDTHRAITIVQSGRLQFGFCVEGGEDQVVVLGPGDFILWGVKVLYWWKALERLEAITFRWLVARPVGLNTGD
jgi:hypothetical protein